MRRAGGSSLSPEKRRFKPPRPKRDRAYQLDRPAKAEWPFPFSLFQSARFFYILFGIVMALSLVGGALTLGSRGGGDGGEVEVITQTPTTPPPAGTETPGATTTAGESPAGTATESETLTPTPTPMQWNKPPAMAIDPAKSYLAVITTEKGEIRIELDAAAAPRTVNNFVFLARQGFYDGTTFHRVLPGFVAQGGDPTGTGAGGPGYTIPDEKNDLKHEAGVIAMAKEFDPARGEPLADSAGSQFYITLAPQPALDGDYTVFGRVIAGIEVLQSLTPRDPAATPDAPAGDRITSITIEETPAEGTPAESASETPSPTP